MSQSLDPSGPRPLPLSPADIKAFVLANPEHFAGDTDLLAALVARKKRDSNVLDLQSYVITRLRDDMDAVRAHGQALIEAATSNLLAQERVHAAVLKLIEARSFSNLIKILSNDIGPLIGADAVIVCIEAPHSAPLPHTPPSGIAILEHGTVDDVMGPGVQHLLNDGRKRMPSVYGRNARRVRSEALLRLSFGPHAPDGLLVLGSASDQTFTPDQRTELLSFLARAVERCMCAWLGLDK